MKIDAQHYCILESAELVDNGAVNENLIGILDRFFLICQRSKHYDLIPVEHIREKCVLIENDSECFISVYFEEYKSWKIIYFVNIVYLKKIIWCKINLNKIFLKFQNFIKTRFLY